MTDLALVPVQLQAFVLNPAVCNTGTDDDNGARIVPITQPNYTFLRLDNFVLQPDVMNHADMHNAAPAAKNSRMSDLGLTPPEPRRNRHGVYVHWILPQVYRSGVTSAPSVPADRREDERLRRGHAPSRKPGTGENVKAPAPSSTPEFLQPPTKYLVVRKLDLDSVVPASAKSQFKEYQAWVIESDFLWKIDDIPFNYDLEVDVSPFVVGVADGRDASIVQQAEVFIGRKTPLESWTPNAVTDRFADNLTLLRSNNQLFADFQMHNTNVFSMLDNFVYGTPDEPQYLDQASASYYLIGWHKDTHTDPLYDASRRFTREKKLSGLFMGLADSGIPDTTKAWLTSTDPAHLCLHGAVYDVRWDHSSKPATVPADNYSARLRDQTIPSLAVGTTPMDALLTYISARDGREEPGLIAQLEEDILLIDTLLHARDDGVEGQREAKDTVYNWNFSRFRGGTHFYLGGEDATGRPTQPAPESIKALREVNALQVQLDGCERLARQRRWDMFAIWWKYVSDVANKDREQHDPAFKALAEDLATRITQLDNYADELRKEIYTLTTKEGTALVNVKTGTQPHFYRARDPTLLIGGVDAGWASDFGKNVTVRLPEQTVVVNPPATVTQLAADVLKAFPDVVPLKEVGKLLGEFFTLSPEQGNQKPGDGTCYPQFHDTLDSPPGVQPPILRDQWGNRQPWLPLFVEWEVEYTHVPFDLWALDEQVSRLSDNRLVRYGVEVPSGKPLWEELGPTTKAEPPDTRILSGRVLILPQPTFSLTAKVTQLFTDTPPDILRKYLGDDERQNLLDNMSALQYLSCPLAGLTEGLLTLGMGTHVKPEWKEVANDVETVTAMKAAQFDSAGLNKERLEMIQGNSGLTPYAASVSFGGDEWCPFKPVTHGQFRFRKLNIIDKFGQAIVTIDPTPQRDHGHPPIFPAISDFYEPQAVVVNNQKVANTVVQNNGTACEFIQLPPQINQNARLNAQFVTVADDGDSPTHVGGGSPNKPYWRPTTEWESPIWGWIVTNYADYGIQLFTKDGIFYGEARIGGPNGAIPGPKWSPFKPPPAGTTSTRDLARLDALITRLGQADYLKGFWTMLTRALDSLPPAPDAYAQFLSSVVGKPLALVTTGWSVELDAPPLGNQSTTAKVSSPEKKLIDTATPEDGYTFHVKLGDREREYDGLVGYFDGFPSPATDDTSHKGEELNYDQIKTYFSPPPDPQHSYPNLIPISKTNYPTFQPYHIAPFPETDPPDYKQQIHPADYTNQHNAELSKHIFGAIIDPFTPIHAYSSFLPAQTLELRPWTWQGAMENVVAFLHAGPVTLIPEGKGGKGDVTDGFDEGRELTADNAKQKPPVDVVGVPALGGGEWSWLQPYVDPDTPSPRPSPSAAVGGGDGGGGGDDDLPIPVYNAYGIESKGNLLSPGFQNGPYSAVEGFLMLRRPIMAADPNK
ncbi:uncharacterized protein C8A04DRAFT_29396 [Dichotomopilus funicola]|uniref:Uncharacterized protein n=1 Tax=Dichotomopilus funicola TaxID=1934379 RepID=A0AAN6V2T5_9PEZI|nr:hypothetical protein C8A04DRAFT_29396 [Dichotomopilus funicola]